MVTVVDHPTRVDIAVAMVRNMLTIPGIFDKGQKWVVTVAPHKVKRSKNQNRLYWMWLTCIENETGNGRMDLHDYFRRKYLPWTCKTVMDQSIYLMTSTRKLDSAQFTEYLEKIRQEAAHMGCFLPAPGDPGWEQFEQQVGPKAVIDED